MARPGADRPDWNRVEAWALAHVEELAAEYGGVELRRGRCACPLHGGDNPQAFSVANGKGWHCFTSDCGGGGGVELVALLTNRNRLDVLRELAPRAGVVVDNTPRMTGTGFMKRTTRPVRARAREDTTPPAPPDPLAEERAAGMVPSPAPVVHRAVWDALTLTPRGADYLAGRGLDPDAAHAYGFRSFDSPHVWEAVRESLEASFLLEELQAARWYSAGNPEKGWAPRLWRPGSGEGKGWRVFPSALVIPYWRAGELVRLRYRNLAPDGDRYRDMPGAVKTVPFNADALDDVNGAEIHVCEGELDAFTLHLYGARVVGLPGATSGTAKGGEWLARLADVGRVVTWYDNDLAGQTGRDAFAHALADRYGRAWLAERGRAVTLYDDDVNGCHQRGALADFFTRAEWRT